MTRWGKINDAINICITRYVFRIPSFRKQILSGNVWIPTMDYVYFFVVYIDVLNVSTIFSVFFFIFEHI